MKIKRVISRNSMAHSNHTENKKANTLVESQDDNNNLSVPLKFEKINITE